MIATWKGEAQEINDKRSDKVSQKDGAKEKPKKYRQNQGEEEDERTE